HCAQGGLSVCVKEFKGLEAEYGAADGTIPPLRLIEKSVISKHGRAFEDTIMYSYHELGNVDLCYWNSWPILQLEACIDPESVLAQAKHQGTTMMPKLYLRGEI
ncbi:hypothetical protein, partial [Pseudomonas syringae]